MDNGVGTQAPVEVYLYSSLPHSTIVQYGNTTIAVPSNGRQGPLDEAKLGPLPKGIKKV